ncbi:hypothetical protein IU498_00490 [Nocardia beijingensis]|uniref:hypothetical protein n=1 Tax=Nocardia beijingensis TaxID=95162 RepID=UPI001893A3E2|nr:hypothetical protein [Nocardia beijingensis]MBF6073100.1 hypothetical protein [Nocardia beijingensis]
MPGCIASQARHRARAPLELDIDLGDVRSHTLALQPNPAASAAKLAAPPGQSRLSPRTSSSPSENIARYSLSDRSV